MILVQLIEGFYLIEHRWVKWNSGGAAECDQELLLYNCVSFICMVSRNKIDSDFKYIDFLEGRSQYF